MLQITVTNTSNDIIKQYYGIKEMIKVLIIIKNKQSSRTRILILDIRTRILISNMSITLNGHIFFALKNAFLISIEEDCKLPS